MTIIMHDAMHILYKYYNGCCMFRGICKCSNPKFPDALCIIIMQNSCLHG